MKVKIKVNGSDILATMALLISVISFYFSFFYTDSTLKIIIPYSDTDGHLVYRKNENFDGKCLDLNTKLNILLVNDGNRPVTVLEMNLITSSDSAYDGGHLSPFQRKPVVIPPAETMTIDLYTETYNFIGDSSVFKVVKDGDKVAYTGFDIRAIDYEGKQFRTIIPLGQYYIEINEHDTLFHSLTKPYINGSIID